MIRGMIKNSVSLNDFTIHHISARPADIICKFPDFLILSNEVSLPNFTIPGDLSPSKRYWEKDIVEPEWEMEEGMMTVPFDKIGMGVEVDRERLEGLVVRKEKLQR